MNQNPTVEVFHLHASASEDEIQICFAWIRSQLTLKQPITIMVKRQLKPLPQPVKKSLLPPESPKIANPMAATEPPSEQPVKTIFNSAEMRRSISPSISSQSSDTSREPSGLQQEFDRAMSNSDQLIKIRQLYSCLRSYDKTNPEQPKLLLSIIIELSKYDEQPEHLDRIIDVYGTLEPNQRAPFFQQYRQALQTKIKRKIELGNREAQATRFQEALALYYEALALSDALGDDMEVAFQINVHLGNTYQQLKDPEQALIAWERSIAIDTLDQKTSHYQNELIYLHNNIGQIYYDKKQHAKAIQYWDGAINILERQSQVAPPETQAKQLLGHLLNNVGMIYYQKGDVKKAIVNFEKTIEVYESIYGKHHISVGNRINNLGEAYRSDKQYEKALQMFKRALEIKQNELTTKPSRSLASTLNNIGMTLQNMHNYHEAINYFLQALKMYSEPGVYGDPNQGDGAIQRSNSMHSIAECYRAINDLDNSCIHFEQSFRLKLQELKMYHKSTQHTAIQLASAYFQTNQFEQSMQIFTQVLNGQKEVYGPDSQIVAQTMNNIGTVLSELKHYDQALKYVQDAIRIFEKRLSKQDPYMLKAYENLKTIKQKLDEVS